MHEPQFGHAISASSAERRVSAASASSIAAAKAPSTVAATAATTAPVTRISMRANAFSARRPLSFASPASEGALRVDVADQEVVLSDASGADDRYSATSSCRTAPARSASPRIGRDERARAGAKGGGQSGAQRNSASDARTLQTQRTMTRHWEQMLSDDSVDRFSACIRTQKSTRMYLLSVGQC